MAVRCPSPNGRLSVWSVYTMKGSPYQLHDVINGRLRPINCGNRTGMAIVAHMTHDRGVVIADRGGKYHLQRRVVVVQIQKNSAPLHHPSDFTNFSIPNGNIR